MRTTPYFRRCCFLGLLIVVPILGAMWGGIFLLIFHPDQPLLPDKALLTTPQYTAHVLVIYGLLLAVPGLITLTLWGAWDSYRDYCRRREALEADYQRRSSANCGNPNCTMCYLEAEAEALRPHPANHQP